MDSIIAGFERVLPELGINTYADMSSFDLLCNISEKIAPFIKVMLDSGENCEIFYFITSDVSPEERFSIQKTHDTEKDYTFCLSDDELRERCAHIIEQSKFIKEQCMKYNLSYYETAKDRNKVFEQFIHSLTASHRK